MTALTASRNAPRAEGDLLNYPAAAAKRFWKHSMVAVNAAGNLEPVTAAAGLTVVGVADRYADNTTGAAGAIRVEVRTGCYGMKNSADADAITGAHVGRVVFAVDDQTVALTDGGGTRSRAGTVKFLENGLVYVELGEPGIGANSSKTRIPITLLAASLIGANAKVYRVRSPIAGRLVQVDSVLFAPLTVGDATLTTKIGSTTVTTTPTPLTIQQGGSAAGDVDQVIPTGANNDNAVAEGSILSVTVGGSNTADVAANVTFLIET